MPPLRIIAAVVQSNQALDLMNVSELASLRFRQEAKRLSKVAALLNLVRFICKLPYNRREERHTIVPAANDSPTTDPCQPIARIQPISPSASGVIMVDIGMTGNIAKIFLARGWAKF